MADVKSDPMAATCWLGPHPPGRPWQLRGPTRLYVEIADNDNGDPEYEEWNPATGERVGSGHLAAGAAMR